MNDGYVLLILDGLSGCWMFHSLYSSEQEAREQAYAIDDRCKICRLECVEICSSRSSKY